MTVNLWELLGSGFCVGVGMCLLLAGIRDKSVMSIGWGIGLFAVAVGVVIHIWPVEAAGVVVMVVAYVVDERLTARRITTRAMTLQDDAHREIVGMPEGEQDFAPFEVALKSAGGKRDEVLNAIKRIYAISPEEARDLFKRCPVPIKQFISKQEAEYVKTKLEAVGAVAEVKPM